jgi:hypothetical protein
MELPVTALRGAGDLARRAGTHAGAWALKRPGTPRRSADLSQAAHGVSRGNPQATNKPRQGRKKRRLFRPSGAVPPSVRRSHGLRHGLISCAPAGALRGRGAIS